MGTLLLLLLSPLFATALRFGLLAENGPALVSSDPAARPPGRRGAALWLYEDPSGNRDLYVYGGVGPLERRLRDMWKWESATRRWLWFPPGPGPVGRSHACAWTMPGGHFWLYGGATDDAQSALLGDLWTFVLSDRTWHPRAVAGGPGPLSEAVHWTHVAHGRLHVYHERRIWSYDTVDGTWTVPPNGNGTQLGPELVAPQWAQLNNHVYVLSADERFHRIGLDDTTWTLLSLLNGPQSRRQAYMFASPLQGQVMLFGGRMGGQVFRDFWSYDPNHDTWSELADATRPSPRCDGAVASDLAGTAHLVGGTGSDASLPFNDVWRWGTRASLAELIDSIQWTLDSATLAATWAAFCATLVLLLALGLAIGWCVSRCRARRKRYASLRSLVSEGRNNDLESDL